VDPPAEHLEQRRRDSRVGRDGEGLLRAARLQTARVYDVGITEWGAPGNPVVYAKSTTARPRTVAIYWQYDNHAGDAARRVKEPLRRQADRTGALQEGADRPRRQQLEGRSSAYWNAADVGQGGHRTMPVNLIFIAEGDEERMDTACASSSRIIRISSPAPTR